MPSECGVMSTSTAPTFCPAMMPACTAAPIATHRSGLTSWCAGWPSRSSSSCADQRRARAAADQHDPVDLAGGQLGVVERPLHAVHRPVEQRPDQLLVLARG